MWFAVISSRSFASRPNTNNNVKTMLEVSNVKEEKICTEKEAETTTVCGWSQKSWVVISLQCLILVTDRSKDRSFTC